MPTSGNFLLHILMWSQTTGKLRGQCRELSDSSTYPLAQQWFKARALMRKGAGDLTSCLLPLWPLLSGSRKTAAFGSWGEEGLLLLKLQGPWIPPPLDRFYEHCEPHRGVGSSCAPASCSLHHHPTPGLPATTSQKCLLNLASRESSRKHYPSFYQLRS